MVTWYYVPMTDAAFADDCGSSIRLTGTDLRGVPAFTGVMAPADPCQTAAARGAAQALQDDNNLGLNCVASNFDPVSKAYALKLMKVVGNDSNTYDFTWEPSGPDLAMIPPLGQPIASGGDDPVSKRLSVGGSSTGDLRREDVSCMSGTITYAALPAQSGDPLEADIELSCSYSGSDRTGKVRGHIRVPSYIYGFNPP
jgi:hypothetical protein